MTRTTGAVDAAPTPVVTNNNVTGFRATGGRRQRQLEHVHALRPLLHGLGRSTLGEGRPARPSPDGRVTHPARTRRIRVTGSTVRVEEVRCRGHVRARRPRAAPRRVEAQLRLRQPSFSIVGLADRACQEASTVSALGAPEALAAITVNLASAALRKEGHGLDLAIGLTISQLRPGVPSGRLEEHVSASWGSTDECVRSPGRSLPRRAPRARGSRACSVPPIRPVRLLIGSRGRRCAPSGRGAVGYLPRAGRDRALAAERRRPRVGTPARPRRRARAGARAESA